MFELCPSVFISKVLHKLYPAAPKLEPIAPHVEDQAKSISVKRKASKEGTTIGKITNYLFSSFFWFISQFPKSMQTEVLPTCFSTLEFVAGERPSLDGVGRRMYTVLPPPADYKPDLVPELENVNSDSATAGETAIIIHLSTIMMCILNVFRCGILLAEGNN